MEFILYKGIYIIKTLFASLNMKQWFYLLGENGLTLNEFAEASKLKQKQLVDALKFHANMQFVIDFENEIRRYDKRIWDFYIKVRKSFFSKFE